MKKLRLSPAYLDYRYKVKELARRLRMIADGRPIGSGGKDPLEWVDLFNEPPWGLRRLEVVEDGRAVEFIMEKR